MAITFLAGAAAGVLGDHLFLLHRMHSMHARAPHFLAQHLARRLDLTAAQKQQVEAILVKHHQRINQIQDETRPKVRGEIDAASKEIETVLTPEQREKFRHLPMHLLPRRSNVQRVLLRCRNRRGFLLREHLLSPEQREKFRHLPMH
ncbi:MAG TPA: hypothetical protein VFN10_22170, partial [Thermoanaerobaculia bacterium]|nr:hypothetical protein [Thermoanaerobaculia bacterium]